jgi:uncharacterized membrane protein YgdD (TMEM256/DUF423 family)
MVGQQQAALNGLASVALRAVMHHGVQRREVAPGCCHVLRIGCAHLMHTPSLLLSLLLQGRRSCVQCSSCLMLAGASTLQWTWAR